MLRVHSVEMWVADAWERVRVEDEAEDRRSDDGIYWEQYCNTIAVYV